MNIRKAIESALQYYRAGQTGEAEQLYRKILEKQPRENHALHFLGIISYQQGKYDAAINYIQRELQIDPNNADAYNNLGLALQSKGLMDEAIACFQKAVRLSPHLFNVYYNLANALKNKGELDEAVTFYQKTLRLNPNLAEAHNNLGIIYQEKGQVDEAIQCYQQAIRLNPRLANTYNNLGFALQKKGQADEALTCYQKALQLNPDLAAAYKNAGDIFRGQGNPDEAARHYKKALQADPDLAGAYDHLGNILRETGQIDEAIVCFKEALRRYPDSAIAHNNMGLALREKGQLDEAIVHCKKALQLSTKYPEALNNLGLALQEKGELDEAIQCFRQAIQLNPDFAEAHLNIALSHLLTGNFREGWKEYEWRLKSRYASQRTFRQPGWDGSAIEGHTLLIHAEQGFGDTIQFIRYVPLAAQYGAKVIVECHASLLPLLKDVEGVYQIVAQGAQIPDFDFHCPLLTLPLLFNTTLETVPSAIPYIHVHPAFVHKWKDRMKGHDFFRVGLVWSGNPKNKRDSFRSCPLDAFTPLSEPEGITFFSLQKGPGSEQAKNPPEGMRLLDYTDEIHDFSDTAALIENLDLVISVDTAVAHLAGALGKRVWTLLPSAPDWRWMPDRSDSPWYPTMRLFRQSSLGDWKPVIIQIQRELKELIKERE